jgi:hypothetical protein
MSEINATERQKTQATGAKYDATPTKDSVANEPDTGKRKTLLALLGMAVVVSAAAYGAYYMRISHQAGQRFRAKLDRHFTRRWARISRQAGQRFHAKLDSSRMR